LFERLRDARSYAKNVTFDEVKKIGSQLTEFYGATVIGFVNGVPEFFEDYPRFGESLRSMNDNAHT
jgi:hypothetical protein